MSESIRYIQNSYTINFRRCTEIRRRANDFEDFFKEHFQGHYDQPQIVPIPDELDPEVPRIIFGSRHGFSQIIISQINMALNVTYSPDWQLDIAKGCEYLKERVSALFSLLNKLDNAQVYFSGLITRARLPLTISDTELFRILQDCIAVLQIEADNLHDLNIKIASVLDNKFFSNITIQNYRRWIIEGNTQEIPRLSLTDASERGIEIIGDFNDRFSYNENKSYYSSSDIAGEIIDKGLAQIQYIYEKIRGVKG